LKDTAKHQGLRNQLVSVLEQKGLSIKNVLDAIKKSQDTYFEFQF
jgi:protein-L-isoaspartate(D-aspartate) O-methyltransferase